MQLSQKARKAVAATLAVSTMLMGSVTAIAPKAFAAPHSEGCLVLSGGIVWMITNGTRRGYTSAEVFQSYGYNFSQVVAATAEDVALPVGPIMIYADGTLVKGPNDPLVYLVSGGQKRPFVSGEVFTGLGFSFANIQSAPVNTFSDLPTGANIDSTTMAHPDGVKVISNGTVWEMTATGRMGFASGDNFLSYGYKFAHVVAANAADLAMPDQGAVPARPACTGGSTPVGSVSASLASSNPAASVLVAGQAQADLAHFAFSGSGTVTSITFDRIGVSADATLSNVYLFDGATRLTDAASVSNNKVTFAGSSVFAVNGSKTISVRSDIATGTSGQTVGMKLSSFVVSGATSNVSVSGNLHSIATSTLATVAVGAPTPSAATVDAAADVNVWQSTFTVGNRDVTMNRLALRNIGSITASDLANLKLYVDGVQVGSASGLNSDGYVTFSFSKVLTTGARVVKVTADINGGASRTVQMSLRSAADLGLVDSQYNVGVLATGSFAASAGAQTISTGTMTVVKSTSSASGNVTDTASDVSIGKWTMTAYGEPIKVETLTMGFDSSDAAVTDLRNARLLINGNQVGSTATLNETSDSGTQFTTNFTVVPGSPATVELRADMFDNDGTNNLNANDTITARMIAGSANAQKTVSLGSLAVPGSAVDANAVTVAVGSLTLAANPTFGAQTVAEPATALKIGSWNLTGNSTEAVNLNTLTLDVTVTDVSGGGDATVADVTDVYLKYGNVMTAVKATISATGNTWSFSHTLPVNGSLAIEAYASLGTDFAATDTVAALLLVQGITASSSTSVSTNSGSTLTSATSTVQAPSATVALDASSPVAKIVTDNQTVETGVFKVTTLYDGYTVTDVTVTVVNATNVTSVILKDAAGNTLGTKPGATSVTFNGLNYHINANSVGMLKVSLVLGATGTGAGLTGGEITTAIAVTTGVKVTPDSTGVNANAAGLGSAVTAPVHYVYAATPVVASSILPSTTLVAGTNTLTKFSITPNGGNISWKRMIFDIAKTSAPVLANGAAFTLWNADTNTQIAGTATVRDTADAATCLATLLACRVQFVATSEQEISSTTNYVLKANVTGTLVANDYISTRILSPSAYAASTTYALVAAAGSFAETYAGYGTAASLIWSDVSTSAHATTTSDWTNDYLVKNLPLDSQTLTK